MIALLDFDAFQAAEGAWSELVAASPHPLPFVSHPWVCTWWRRFGADQEFVAQVVTDGGRWLAGVPLAIRSVGWGRARVPIAEIVGTGPVPTRGMGLADKADLVVRRDQPEAGRRLREALRGLLGRVEVIHLKALDAGSTTTDLLSPLHGPTTWRGPRSVSPYLPLPGSLDELLRSRSKNFRKTLRKNINALVAAGRVTFERLGPGDDCSAWMDAVLAVSRSSWQARQGTDLFRHPALRAFFLELAAAMAERGWLDLHLLRIDARPCAYELGFDFGGRVYSYTGGFDRGFAPLSPGSVLTSEVIASACRRGRTEYDFLRGGEAYKRRWTDRSRQQLEGLLRTDGPGARAYATVAVRWKRRLKARPWLARLDERLTGLAARWRHGG